MVMAILMAMVLMTLMTSVTNDPWGDK